jgi:hypothetical protein
LIRREHYSSESPVDAIQGGDRYSLKRPRFRRCSILLSR